MFWIKTFHIFFVISWFACLFYLPRLYVNHAMQKEAANSSNLELLSGMEKRLIKMMNFTLFFVILTGMLFLYKVSGAFSAVYFVQKWVWVKFVLLLFLFFYHYWCIKIHKNFEQNQEKHSHIWFRVFNEVPVFALLGILYMVIAKPF